MKKNNYPKSKNINRRNFIKASLATTTALACCSAGLGPAKVQMAFAQASSANRKTAIFFNLFGGNDQLNTFAVPWSVDAYHDRRPTLKIAEADVLKMAQGIGLVRICQISIKSINREISVSFRELEIPSVRVLTLLHSAILA